MSFILPLKSYPHAGFGIFLLCKCLEFFTILYFRIIIAELAAIFTEFLLNTTSSALKLLLKLSNSYLWKCKCKRMRKGEVYIYVCVCLSVYIYICIKLRWLKLDLSQALQADSNTAVKVAQGYLITGKRCQIFPSSSLCNCRVLYKAYRSLVRLCSEFSYNSDLTLKGASLICVCVGEPSCLLTWIDWKGWTLFC